jgi:hypothetical protein
VKSPSIYARASNDSAGNFSEVINVSNTDYRMARHPHVTIAGGKMVAIWEEVGEDGEASRIKVSSLVLKALATGPALEVDPTMHVMTGNQH